MEQILSIVIPAIVTGLTTYFLTRKKDNVEVKSIDLDNAEKAAKFYQGLLDDATKRLNESIKAIEERDVRIRLRDEKIELLIDEIEKLTDELKKYKQLSGKTT